MNKAIISAVIGTIVAMIGASQASARPDVRTMSCDQAKQLTRSKGAVVFTFTNNTYDRVVKNVHYCSSLDEKTEAVFVSTQDSNRCNIGKRCTGEFPEYKDDF